MVVTEGDTTTQQGNPGEKQPYDFERLLLLSTEMAILRESEKAAYFKKILGKHSTYSPSDILKLLQIEADTSEKYVEEILVGDSLFTSLMLWGVYVFGQR